MSPLVGDPYSLVVELGAVFDGVGAPYYLGGGLASTLLGQWRTTHDIDVVVALAEREVPQLLAALGTAWEVDDEALLEAVRLRDSMNFFHVAPFMIVDLYVAKDEPFQQSVMGRRLRSQAPGGGELWISSQEDLILQKLRWYRLGGQTSERQWRDVQGVMLAWWEKLDRAYLGRWARELLIADLLQDALAEAGRSS